MTLGFCGALLSLFFFFSLPNVKLRDGSTYTHTSFARTDLIPLHERDPPLHYSSVFYFFFRLSLFYGLISRSHLRSAKVCSVSLAFFFFYLYILTVVDSAAGILFTFFFSQLFPFT